MAAICANPEEDAPRLIFADYLEEQGETARADFIRVQCELAELDGDGTQCPVCYWSIRQDGCQVGNCSYRPDKHHYDYPGWSQRQKGYHELRQRERELWESQFQNGEWVIMPELAGRDWHVCLPTDNLASATEAGLLPILVVRRGFVAEIRCGIATLMGGPCQACDGVGILDQVMNWCRCIPCNGTGRIPGIGPTLVRQQPVVKVVITDKRPGREPGEYLAERYGRYRWFKADHGIGREMELPAEVFELACPGDMPDDAAVPPPWWFRTEQSAIDALSKACLLLVQSRAQELAQS